MSDDFDQFDDFDDSFLQQVDAIEQAEAKPRAATLPNSKRTSFSLFAAPTTWTRPPTNAARSVSGPSTHTPSTDTNAVRFPARTDASASASTRPAAKPPSSDPYDLSFDLDPAAVASLTQIENTFQRTGSTSSAKYQTTLYGTLARTPPRAAAEGGRSAVSAGPAGGAMAPARVGPFGRANQRTKQWDRTQFAATGIRNKGRTKRKKGRPREEEDESGEDLEEDVEFEQFPVPFVPSG
ncbi:hypothetical protein CALVIDRAFT_358266 [Calocera viscosa TUFC12733]|uniref:Uncharacterized protein n=1 Tax=Calocera viscosa (strain TUFC12733) TaxID=1330018 RepID=A0A167QGE3_CALVF|nr:hypothetical protein CALVIDRAFT_358266 [Calocera viscosa TUFC12733]